MNYIEALRYGAIGLCAIGLIVGAGLIKHTISLTRNGSQQVPGGFIIFVYLTMVTVLGIFSLKGEALRWKERHSRAEGELARLQGQHLELKTHYQSERTRLLDGHEKELEELEEELQRDYEERLAQEAGKWQLLMNAQRDNLIKIFRDGPKVGQADDE